MKQACSVSFTRVLWRTIDAQKLEDADIANSTVLKINLHVTHLRLPWALPWYIQECGMFISLQSLEVLVGYDGDNPDNLSVMLEYLSSLTSLKVTMYNIHVPLSHIFVISKNLTELSFTAKSITWDTANDSGIPKILKLADLRLQSTGHQIQESDLDMILQKCPALRRLFISECNLASMLTMTNRYCQHLAILIVNNRYYPDRPSLKSNEQKADGLQVFHCGEWDPIPLPDIIRLITQFDYHKYLEEMVISGEQFEHHPFIEYNFGHQFKQLRILQYSNDDVPIRVFEAIGMLSRLRSLVLDSITLAEQHDEVKRLLFSNQVAASEYSTLHYIRGHSSGRMELADAFSFLAVMLTNLRTIDIRCDVQSNQYFTILDESLEEFLEESAPGVTCIRLDGDMSALDNKTLGQIVPARKLEYLGLLGYADTKLDDGLITLIMSADPPLKHIEIKSCLVAKRKVVIEHARYVGTKLTFVD